MFWIVRYPPAILAPPGVARLQPCVMTRILPPSSARAGAAHGAASRTEAAIARVIDISASLSIFILYSSSDLLQRAGCTGLLEYLRAPLPQDLQTVDCRMQRTQHPDDC